MGVSVGYNSDVSICRLISIGVVIVFVCGCRSQGQNGHATVPIPSAVVAEPRAIVVEPVHPQGWEDPPLYLPVFGTETSDSIRVAVYGYSVNRPGYYYLTNGSTVHDAIQSAHGLKDIISWEQPYSGIKRTKADGSQEMIWFSRTARSSNEVGVLKNADWLRVSHEAN
jgi:hypothetical protein